MKAFAWVLLIFALSGSAVAQDSRPAHHPSRQLEMEKKESESRKAELEAQAKKLDRDMENTQDELVQLARDIKKNEKRLNELDAEIAAGHKEQDEIEARLKKDRRSIGDLVLALQRLERTPPEAILARPGAPLETAQSAMLLQSILPDIYSRAENLKKDLARLEEIIRSLQDAQLEAKETSEKLVAREAEVGDLLKKRKSLYAKTQSGIKEEESALREISARADNLKELVDRIDQRQKQEEEERTRLAAASTERAAEPARAARLRPTPIPKTGAAQLPISGLIRVGYKQLDDIGAESQGLTLEGRPRGLVVAPMGGVVRYAGYFKNYGQIIIVEHQKDYHSLIAGLARIDTVVGQSVAAGEPVGALAKTSSDGGKPTLYYELRLNGEPVNPARKFAGL